MNQLRHLAAPLPETTITIDGTTVAAFVGEPLAAVFLRQPDVATRCSTVSGEKRAPFCMMGVCFECLVGIDGAFGLRSCQEAVRPGMCVVRQAGVRRLGE